MKHAMFKNKSNAMPKSVLLVQSEKMFPEALQYYLQAEEKIEVVAQKSSGADCLSFLKSQQVDAVISSMRVADDSGLSLCAKIKKASPGVAVILLCSVFNASYVRAALKAGASAFVMRKSGLKELSNALKHKKEEGIYLCNSTSRAIANKAIQREPGEQQLPDVLTRRERQILRLMAEGFTNLQISKELFISDNTVKTHRKRVMKKLGLGNIVDVVRYHMKYFE